MITRRMTRSTSLQAMQPKENKENKLVANRKPKLSPKRRLPCRPFTSQPLAAATNFSDLRCLAREESRPCEAPASSPDLPLVEEVAQVDKEHRIVLPAHIPDVDADDNNTLMVPEYVKDIFAYLKTREALFLPPENYMSSHTQIKPKMRFTLVDWLLEVACNWDLCLDTYYLCVSILDRYLASKPTQATHELQLVGATALWIASKVEEIYCLDVNDLEHVCNKQYATLQFIHKEREMLTALDFDLHAPLPIIFLRRFSKVAGVDNRQHHAAKFLLEVASLYYEMSSTQGSKTAAAALHLTLCLTSESDKAWSPTLEFYTGFSSSDLAPVVSQLAALTVDVYTPRKHRSAVLKKYAQQSNFFISESAEFSPSNPVLQSFIKR